MVSHGKVVKGVDSEIRLFGFKFHFIILRFYLSYVTSFILGIHICKKRIIVMWVKLYTTCKVLEH